MQFIDLDLGFDDWCCDTGNAADLGLNVAGSFLEHVEVVAVYFDGDLGVHAGKHVTDEVGQRLLSFQFDAGKFLFQTVE